MMNAAGTTIPGPTPMRASPTWPGAQRVPVPVRPRAPARAPFQPPSSIDAWGERLAWCFAQPARPVSYRPLAYASMPGLGKLGLSYGASLVARDVGEPGRPWLVGTVIMASSACVVFTGVVLLGNTVGCINRRAAPWLKITSILGGVLMGLGYGIGSYGGRHSNVTWAIAVGAAAKWTGTAMMGLTLPTFVTHAVAVLGDTPFERHQGSVALVLMAGGVATLVVSASLANTPHMPLAASSALTVAATFACALATGIYSCALPSAPYARASPAQRFDAAPPRRPSASREIC